MKNIFYVSFVMALLSCSNQKQKQKETEKEIPVLKTNSKTVSIKDGNILHDDIWTISPEVELDEFVASKFIGEKKVSFMSDIDTLTFTVTPNSVYDFVIQHKEEKAHTRLNTDTSKDASIENREVFNFSYKDKKESNERDTIPFTIGDDNRIYIKGKINDSDSLNIIFDTGANGFTVTSSLVGNKVKLKMDGETLNKRSDGSSMRQTSSNNNLEVGNLVWDKIKFTSIDYKGYAFDGVIGWVAFGGKTVEIDYENQILVIHKSFESIPDGYFKVETAMMRGLPYISGIITVNNIEHSGWFEYDTGGSRSFYLSQQYVVDNKIHYKDMEFIDSYGSSGSTGANFKRDIYFLPKLKFGAFETYQIPIAIAQKDPEGIKHNDILGNDLLKRFNAIIDFQNFEIYLKPNSLLHTAYKE